MGLQKARVKWRSWNRTVILLIALTILQSQPVSSEKKGAGSDALLDSLNGPLHSRGIDILPGRVGDVPISPEDPPRLARLDRFPIQLVDSARPKSRSWESDFERGAFEYIVAYRPSSPSNLKADGDVRLQEFVREWESTPKEQRVFVAFARDDQRAAKEIVEVLRKKKMIAFVYIRNGETSPWADPNLVGRFFREAGQHLVIDSLKARKSSGVAFEALNLFRLKALARDAKPSSKMTCREAVMGG